MRVHTRRSDRSELIANDFWGASSLNEPAESYALGGWKSPRASIRAARSSDVWGRP